MSFKDEYTTADLILAESSIPIKEGEVLIDDGKIFTEVKVSKEADKTVLSNDFYMLGQYLECIINRMGRL